MKDDYLSAPPKSARGGDLLPINFDGSRRRPKPLDALGFDGMTLRDKKLLQFKDQVVKRRKQLNMRNATAAPVNIARNEFHTKRQYVFSAGEEDKSFEDNQQVDDLLNLSREGSLISSSVEKTKYYYDSVPANLGKIPIKHSLGSLPVNKNIKTSFNVLSNNTTYG